MKTPSLFKSINKNKNVLDALTWPYDFEICKPYLLSKKWPIKLSEELLAIAEDGTGGAIAICNTSEPDESPILYLSSEGQAGKVANKFSDFFSILIALPYWRDLLKFSSNGNIKEMRKAQKHLEIELLEDEPEIEGIKRLIIGVVKFKKLKDPIKALHDATKSKHKIKIFSKDGEPWNPLFGSFKVSDNLSWKSK